LLGFSPSFVAILPPLAEGLLRGGLKLAERLGLYRPLRACDLGANRL
jgi:hypothetical protein